MSTSKLIRICLTSQVQAVLATVSVTPKGTPPKVATHLMAYGLSPNLKSVYFATSMNTRKAENMINNKNVSVLWDNRTGNVNDHKNGLLVTCEGEAYAISNKETRVIARDSILEKNPNMSKFLEGGNLGFFEVKVDEYVCVVGYDAPKSWSPSDLN